VKYLVHACRAAFLPALLILVAAGCASAPRPDAGVDARSDGYEEMLAAGDSAARQGDFRAALVLYDQALDAKESAEVWFRLGAAHQQLGQTDAAAHAFGRVVALDPTDAAGYEAAGLIHLREGRIEQAKPLLRRAVELDETRWQAHNGLGVLADIEQATSEAVAYYQAALAVRPGSAMLLNNIGYSNYLAGNYAAAIRHFELALTYDTYEPAILNLGLVYARQGLYGLAVDTLTRVMDRSQACNDVGFIALNNGHYQTAQELLQEAIRLSPVHYETAQRNLALARAGGVN
jgi:Flp pilus assembly protein TadD